MSQVLLLVGCILFILFATAVTALLGWLWWRKQKAVMESASMNQNSSRVMAEAVESLKRSVDSLDKSLGVMVEGIKDIPALERGLIEVSKSQVSALGELREQQQEFNSNVQKLYGSLFNKNSSAYQEYDDRTAGKAYRVQELIEKGIDRDEAEARAEQEQRVYSRGNIGVG